MTVQTAKLRPIEVHALEARMKNPAGLLPGAYEAIQALIASVNKSGAPPELLKLVHLRASMINGCSACVDGGVRHAREAGETDERLFAVSAWREAPYFTDAERAALKLAEAITNLDPADPVPDHIWSEAARHYDERALAGIVLWAAVVNMFNRANIATQQVAGKAW
jgi:AhpD family alkylhydroperoxidase